MTLDDFILIGDLHRQTDAHRQGIILCNSLVFPMANQKMGFLIITEGRGLHLSKIFSFFLIKNCLKI